MSARRTAIVPRVVMTVTAAAVLPAQFVACSSSSSGPNYIALAVGAFGGMAEGGAGGAANHGGTAGTGGHGGSEVMMGGAAGEAGEGGTVSVAGTGFIVLAAAAFGGEAGGNNR